VRERYEWFNPALLALTAMLMVAALYMIFVWVPDERQQGPVYRIFFFHVPVAWTSFLAFFLVFIGSILYLWKRDEKYDIFAHSAAELGVVFASLMLISGSIWAKPIWGVWWIWEPRLTTSLILWLIYVAYLMVRMYATGPGQGARFAAILGIIGFIDVPIVYFSVILWRTIHPQPLVAPGDMGLEPSMIITLNVCVLTFTLLFIYLLRERIGLRRMGYEMEQLRQLGRS